MFPVRPAKADPLFAVAEQYAYSISVNPCAPLLLTLFHVAPLNRLGLLLLTWFQLAAVAISFASSALFASVMVTASFPGGRLQFAASAVKRRLLATRMSTARIAILTSYFSIFFPTYSGVRPTISPAMNTATTAYISIP